MLKSHFLVDIFREMENLRVYVQTSLKELLM
ncbi:hypothetical protein KAI37_04747 [Paenibacillus sp. S25]|nr:hypothetical protein KAI37_04747 [Paenibacillus sp. S25]